LGTTIARPGMCIISSTSKARFFISALGHLFLYFLATREKMTIQHCNNVINFSREEK